MATAFNSIPTRKYAIPCPPTCHATAAKPANDNTSAAWVDDPRARMLLASCVANPPLSEWKRSVYTMTTDEWFEYTGYRAEALDAIRMAHGQRVLQAYHTIGDAAYPAYAAWCSEPDVTAAIADAVNAVREG